MPVPIHKYPAAVIDETLRQYTGIGLGDLSGVGGEHLIYLEEYDAYYTYTSDFGPGMFNCVRGETQGDLVRLYDKRGEGGTIVLTLRNVDGVYLIVSHQTA